jgi:hypothetical protein
MPSKPFFLFADTLLFDKNIRNPSAEDIGGLKVFVLSGSEL